MARSVQKPAPKASRSLRRSGPVKKVPFAAAPANFLDSFYQHVLPADLALFSNDERARIAASIWRLAASRRRGENKVHVFDPSPDVDGWTVDHTVIEIISDDMPFLVDSVTGVLQNRGLGLHIVIHPILYVKRDGSHRAINVASLEASDTLAESFMHIQVDHCVDVTQLRLIEEEIRATLSDVGAAVADWQVMRGKMQDTCTLIEAPKNSDEASEDIEEVRAFLRWLSEDNFTFLGYREIDLRQKSKESGSIRVVPGSGLGILRDDQVRLFGGLRDLDKRNHPALRQYIQQHQVLFVTKTNTITRVHRVLPMDAVFIRRFDAQGAVIGERLFVGLFTSKTYSQTPRDIPFMRRKIANVIAKMGFAPKSHDGRALAHILNTYPHDELFQISDDELLANAMGILQLQERARVALFTRRDPFGRYVTCLVYVPRDRYDSALRNRIQDFLEKAFDGKAQPWNVRIDDSRLARAFVNIHLTPESFRPDLARLEADLREMCRTWSDRLRDSLVAAYGEATALVLLRRYGDAFSQTYRDTVPPARAIQDVRNLERLRSLPRFLADLDNAGDGRMRLKLFVPDRPLLLSEVLPVIENMGLKVDFMGGPYDVTFKDGTPPAYIHEFVCKAALPSVVEFEHVKAAFEEALEKVWAGEVENDSFNALTLRSGFGWSGIVVLRAFARYLRQLRIPYSHEMMAAAMLANPQTAQRIYALFYARHNPSLTLRSDKEIKAIENALTDDLASITVLEEDRIIRRYVNLVKASVRTNFFQRNTLGGAKAYLSIKFDSRAVDFMPLPKPIYEIFVYSPAVEAVHMRGGKVARGGIRWSDRRDDFRSEILGLMKAQMVKNSVIVPVGSKGGFIVKRPPSGGADKTLAEGISCYTTMMCGLLDVTDNFQGGKIVPPKDVARLDGDDPYLVVAADKGTASFSDIANGISQSYGFWLDDAFASGGSAGYDHKAMGITARGAWEAIKRHFRETGKNIQSEDFSCIGVGDMSGDVFGNAMLLSEHTRVIGAFDHRHIFCDPSPDTAKSYGERKRLFAMARSSWNDYDRKLISKGGNVFSRSEKSIKISAEMKKAYGISVENLAPADLMQAMLKADVELLYFGGIGTYVKSSEETNEEVGDRSNEGLRINGNEIRAKILGEGANLGLTQRGRVEYALNGGRLNTDAIDNSAGVDTSDHEVNIKILLRKAVDKKLLTLSARNKLLASMTTEVGLLVLRDNYLQTQALSVLEAQAVELLSTHVRCMQVLEKSGLLNRSVEFLPNDTEIAERQKSGKGLTRPELAVLLAYAKIWLYHKILESKLPDDAALQGDVDDYFPTALRKVYAKDIAQHQLRRELAATVLTNDIVNRAGIRVVELIAEHGNTEDVARAYLLARHAFGLPDLFALIERLDGDLLASSQIQLLMRTQIALIKGIEHFLSDRSALSHLSTSIQASTVALKQLADWLAHHSLTSTIGAGVQVNVPKRDLPPEMKLRVAHFEVLAGATDLIALAARHKLPIGDMAAIFFGFEKRLSIDWLNKLSAAPTQTSWQREAVTAALDELSANHKRLTTQLAARRVKGKSKDVASWAEANAERLAAYDALLAEWHLAPTVDLAMLLLANERLSELSA